MSRGEHCLRLESIKCTEAKKPKIGKDEGKEVVGVGGVGRRGQGGGGGRQGGGVAREEHNEIIKVSV